MKKPETGLERVRKTSGTTKEDVSRVQREVLRFLGRGFTRVIAVTLEVLFILKN